MLNRVILVGALTSEPELRYQEGDGIPEANFPIIVEHQDAIEFTKNEEVIVDIIVYNKQAENCAEHLKLGSCVAVTGRLSKIKDKQEGNNKLFVIAEDVRFMPKNLARNNNS